MGTKRTWNDVRSILLEEEARGMRGGFERAHPFPHGVLRPFCSDEDLLRSVRKELLERVAYREKETDLFRVSQTGDLANLDGFSEELPALCKLRDALYSNEFRQAVEEATGCGKLSDQIDISSNIYLQGGHLLCHDDVIGSRRVSFIIYLTDPDSFWKEEEGGSLELFGIDDRGECSNVPCKTILPQWNTMAFFVVTPGRSYHEVREVFAEGKPRLSISGWYHSDVPLKTSTGVASLEQLHGGKEEIVSRVYRPLSCEGDLNKEDFALLRGFLNPAYLSPNTWHQVADQLQAQGSIQLQSFLAQEFAQKVLSECIRADEEDGLNTSTRPAWEAGTGGGWMTIGPPVKQRYQEYIGSEDVATARAAAGETLKSISKSLLQSTAFVKLINLASGRKIRGQLDHVRRFRPGMDYTVAHLNEITRQPVVELTLCFVNDVDDASASRWESGEAGGYHCYIPADSENSAATAEVYRPDDDDDELLSISAASNSVSIVVRKEGLMDFVKYVGAKAGGSRWDIAMEYQMEE